MSVFEEIRRLYEDLNPELTLFVHPDKADEIRSAVAAADLPARITVVSNPMVDPDKMWVSNETLHKRSMEDAARSPLGMGEQR